MSVRASARAMSADVRRVVGATHSGSPPGDAICCHPDTALEDAALISTGVWPLRMPASNVTIAPTMTNDFCFISTSRMNPCARTPVARNCKPVARTPESPAEFREVAVED